QSYLTYEKKDEKLNEIIKFIQNKLLLLFDEDLILKCFGMCLCDLSPNNDDQSGYLTNVLKSLQKHIDINDGKLANLFYKYYSIKNFMLYQTMNMKYLITYRERLIIAKYPQPYVLF
ncbi:unnamed protein product, partial [Rotaria sp. Silwood1]